MIEDWNKKLCTTIGKSNVAKSLMLSKLTHYSISLASPNWKKMQEIQNMISKFIWGKGTPIGLEQAKLSYEKGGLKLIKLDEFWKFMKISWFRRALYSEDIWCNLLKADLKELGVNSIEELLTKTPNEIQSIGTKMQNPFWKEAMSALSMVSIIFHSTNKQRALKQIMSSSIQT